MVEDKNYFAFGSNLSSQRLRARVGEIVVVGRALLCGYRHAFNKRGADGTAKGNIVRAETGVVYGALYALELHQFERLRGYEGGYRAIDLDVSIDDGSGRQLRASTFQALDYYCDAGLEPAEWYLEHYRVGGREHALPDDYLAEICGFDCDPRDAR